MSGVIATIDRGIAANADAPLRFGWARPSRSRPPRVGDLSREHVEASCGSPRPTPAHVPEHDDRGEAWQAAPPRPRTATPEGESRGPTWEASSRRCSLGQATSRSAEDVRACARLLARSAASARLGLAEQPRPARCARATATAHADRRRATATRHAHDDVTHALPCPTPPASHGGPQPYISSAASPRRERQLAKAMPPAGSSSDAARVKQPPLRAGVSVVVTSRARRPCRRLATGSSHPDSPPHDSPTWIALHSGATPSSCPPRARTQRR